LFRLPAVEIGLLNHKCTNMGRGGGHRYTIIATHTHTNIINWPTQGMPSGRSPSSLDFAGSGTCGFFVFFGFFVGFFFLAIVAVVVVVVMVATAAASTEVGTG
jgi:hypothetical protein